MGIGPEPADDNLIDLYEQLLFERAANGIRPVLYVSTPKDLECAVAMLLEEPSSDIFSMLLNSMTGRMGPQPMAN